MSTLQDRLLALRAENPAVTNTQLAKLAGVKPPSVSDWFSGRTSALKWESAKAIAQAYGVTDHWVTSGAPPKRQQDALELEGLSTGSGVPLISWVKAGCWADVSDPHQLGEADDWLPCPVRHGPRTYCLRVRGDSMHNPSGRPSYADGDIIFVDPDRDAKPGDRVIVRLDDQQEATFKQLLIEDGRKLLKALNPEWAPRYIEINGNATIAGVVIGKWVPE